MSSQEATSQEAARRAYLDRHYENNTYDEVRLPTAEAAAGLILSVASDLHAGCEDDTDEDAWVHWNSEICDLTPGQAVVLIDDLAERMATPSPRRMIARDLQRQKGELPQRVIVDDITPEDAALVRKAAALLKVLMFPRYMASQRRKGEKSPGVSPLTLEELEEATVELIVPRWSSSERADREKRGYRREEQRHLGSAALLHRMMLFLDQSGIGEQISRTMFQETGVVTPARDAFQWVSDTSGVDYVWGWDKPPPSRLFAGLDRMTSHQLQDEACDGGNDSSEEFRHLINSAYDDVEEGYLFTVQALATVRSWQDNWPIDQIRETLALNDKQAREDKSRIGGMVGALVHEGMAGVGSSLVDLVLMVDRKRMAAAVGIGLAGAAGPGIVDAFFSKLAEDGSEQDTASLGTATPKSADDSSLH